MSAYRNESVLSGALPRDRTVASSRRSVEQRGERFAPAGTSDIFGAIATVRHGWRLVALIALPIFAFAYATAELLVPLYDTAARIQIDPLVSRAVWFRRSELYLPADQAVIDTEVSILQSDDLVRTVVRELGLARDPEFNDGLRAGGRPSTEDEVVRKVSDRFTISREYGIGNSLTYLASIGFRSADPEKAARAANALAADYIRFNVEARARDAARRSSDLSAQLGALSGEVAGKDARVADYLGANRLTRDVKDPTVTEKQIASISGQLASIDAQAAGRRSALAAARAQAGRYGIDATGVSLASPTVRAMRGDRADLVAERAALVGRYGPRHPEVQRVDGELARVDQELGQEAQRSLGSLRADATSTEANAAALRAELGRLRAQQAQDARASVGAGNLRRDAEQSSRAYSYTLSAARQADQDSRGNDPQARIIEAAPVPDAPTTPNKPLFKVMGLLAGLLAGAAAVLFRDSFRDRIRDDDGLARLGLATVGVLPDLPARRLRGRQPWDMVPDEPASAYAEGLRAVRAALRTPAALPNGGVLAVCSALPGDGKSSLATSLAMAMALSGDTVLLIDGDARNSGLKAAVSDDDGGLAAVLAGRAAPDDVILRDGDTGLSLLPVGRVVGGAAALASHAGPLRRLVEGLRDRYDVIVIDTPPVLAVADAATLAALADGVLLAVRWDRTPARALAAALASLRRTDAAVIGAVLVRHRVPHLRAILRRRGDRPAPA